MFASSIIKIVVAEDHKLIKEAIINLLNSFPNFLICDEAETANELVEKYFKSKPDLILIDACMKPINGLEAISEIRKADQNAKALFFSVIDDKKYINKIIEIGGHGYVSKYISSNELALAINTIISGDYYYGNNQNNHQAHYTKKPNGNILKSIEVLSQREEEIIALLASGLSSKEIGDRLFISKRTVDTHRMHISQKFNLKGSAELLQFAFRYFNSKESQESLA